MKNQIHNFYKLGVDGTIKNIPLDNNNRISIKDNLGVDMWDCLITKKDTKLGIEEVMFFDDMGMCREDKRLNEIASQIVGRPLVGDCIFKTLQELK